MTIMKTTVSLLVLFFLSLKASAIFGLGDPDYCKKNPNDLLCSTGLNKVVEDTGLTDALSPFGDLLKTDEQKQLEAERIAKDKAEAERIARERAEAEAKRVAEERTKAEAERVAKEKAKAEAERVAKEKAEAEAELKSIEKNIKRSADLSKLIQEKYPQYPTKPGSGKICVTGYKDNLETFVFYRKGSYDSRLGSNSVSIKGPNSYSTYKQYDCKAMYDLQTDHWYFSTYQNTLYFKNPNLREWRRWKLGENVKNQKIKCPTLFEEMYSNDDQIRHCAKLSSLAKTQWEYVFSIASNLVHPDDKKLPKLVDIYSKKSSRTNLPKINQFPIQSIDLFNAIQENNNLLLLDEFKLAIAYLDYIGDRGGVYRQLPDIYQFIASHKLKELDFINNDSNSDFKYFDINKDGFVSRDEFTSIQIHYLANRMFYRGTNELIFVEEPSWDYKGKTDINKIFFSRSCQQKFLHNEYLKSFKLKRASNKNYQNCLRDEKSAYEAAERCVASQRCTGEALFAVSRLRESTSERCNPIINSVKDELKKIVGSCSKEVSF